MSREIPELGFAVNTSSAANHTYQMEVDALTSIGHDGFVNDAQAIAALLFDLATRPAYLQQVKTESAKVKLFSMKMRRHWTRPTLRQPSLIQSRNAN